MVLEHKQHQYSDLCIMNSDEEEENLIIEQEIEKFKANLLGK